MTAISSAYNQTCENLDYLKLSQMRLHLDDIARMVNADEMSFTEGLLKLTNYEVDFQETKAANSMIKAAAFPFEKGIDDFDFEFQPSVRKQQILELSALGFMEKAENVVFLGPSGVGKTHLATAIGISAVKKRNITYFIKCHDLLQQLKKAKRENRLDSRLKHFNHYRLLIIDEIGYLPIDKEDSDLFFQLVDMRYEKKSMILTTNINFNEWDDIFHNAIVADAILNRLLHHAHVVSINGPSYRLKDLVPDEKNCT